MKLTVGELRSIQAIKDMSESRSRWLKTYVERDYEALEPDACQYIREWAFPSSLFGDSFRSKFTDKLINDYIEFNIPDDYELHALFMTAYSRTHAGLYAEIFNMNGFTLLGKAIIFRASQFLLGLGYVDMAFSRKGEVVLHYKDGNSYSLLDSRRDDYMDYPIFALQRLSVIHREIYSPDKIQLYRSTYPIILKDYEMSEILGQEYSNVKDQYFYIPCVMPYESDKEDNLPTLPPVTSHYDAAKSVSGDIQDDDKYDRLVRHLLKDN